MSDAPGSSRTQTLTKKRQMTASPSSLRSLPRNPGKEFPKFLDKETQKKVERETPKKVIKLEDSVFFLQVKPKKNANSDDIFFFHCPPNYWLLNDTKNYLEPIYPEIPLTYTEKLISFKFGDQEIHYIILSDSNFFKQKFNHPILPFFMSAKFSSKKPLLSLITSPFFSRLLSKPSFFYCFQYFPDIFKPEILKPWVNSILPFFDRILKKMIFIYIKKNNHLFDNQKSPIFTILGYIVKQDNNTAPFVSELKDETNLEDTYFKLLNKNQFNDRTKVILSLIGSSVLKSGKSEDDALKEISLAIYYLLCNQLPSKLSRLIHFDPETQKYHHTYLDILRKFLKFPVQFYPSTFIFSHPTPLVPFFYEHIDEFIKIIQDPMIDFHFKNY